MMKILRDLYEKDTKLPVYAGLMLILGVFMMILAGPLFRGGQSGSTEEAAVRETELETQPYGAPVTETPKSYTYERALEKRLEEALSLVDGVGQVRVLVTFSQGRETIFAVDRNINTSIMQEQDAQGGTRYQSSQQGQDTTLFITDRTGVDRPLIVKETPPVIGGVMIIAGGGDDVLVRDALIRATSTLLGIDINRVHVMKMKNVR